MTGVVVNSGKLLALDSGGCSDQTVRGEQHHLIEKADGEQTIETQNPIEDILRLQKEAELTSTSGFLHQSGNCVFEFDRTTLRTRMNTIWTLAMKDLRILLASKTSFCYVASTDVDRRLYGGYIFRRR